jgi:hypothetical protein
MREISESLFSIFALSLPRGLGFGDTPPIGAWISDNGNACGVITKHANKHQFGLLVMRRRIDQVWQHQLHDEHFDNKDVAFAKLKHLLSNSTLVSVPPGVRRRPALYDLSGKEPSNIFKSLSRKSHHIAARVLNELYLALPNPDANWASDCQTKNFHTRLWEAHLLACFREQGLFVEQNHVSPDFRISNRAQNVAWVEAVTTNPEIPYDHVSETTSLPPENTEERLTGAPAIRFAKTIHSKLQRDYHTLSHVKNYPFAIAIADFQASGSMTWSREALISYLYGVYATAERSDNGRVLSIVEVETLLGKQQIPAGLFCNDERAELSAVIFSNGCAISKLNRVPISGGADSKGYRYLRFGTIYDRTPGALDPIPFMFDVATEEYRRLWLPHYDYEPWSAEMEIFHNPFAQHPFPQELLPEANHWKWINDELYSQPFHEVSILKSRTLVINDDTPVPTLEQLFGNEE